ncbi:MAG: hypothetical protein RIC95_09675 [Vicingaceae bacterium]
MTKRIIILLIHMLILTACEKEESDSSLNIIYLKSELSKQQKGVQNLPENISIRIFPNPFLKETTIGITGEGKKTITVSDDEGRFKVIPITDQTFKLNFSEEKKGSYYSEVKIGNTVIPITLVKAE